MKVAPLISACEGRFRQLLVHTGQHYDHNMSDIFFDNIDLPEPDIYLGVGSGSHAQMTARVLMEFEPVLIAQKPDLVIVVGDVNSTLACSIAAVKLGIRTAHVEAGLRSFDRSMPEEINRILTDQISDFLFITEKSAHENLIKEGIPEEKIHFVGNVMIDTLVRLLPRTDARSTLADMNLVTTRNTAEKTHKDYVLVTLHRPRNVDTSAVLDEILRALRRISEDVPVIFPVHPRTRKMIDALDLDHDPARLQLIDPLGYLDFLTLMKNAALVLTDSGGIQEETTFLRIPCLTVRPNTERPITIEIGTNQLVANTENKIYEKATNILKTPGSPRETEIPPYWDGHTADRIVNILGEKL